MNPNKEKHSTFRVTSQSFPCRRISSITAYPRAGKSATEKCIKSSNSSKIVSPIVIDGLETTLFVQTETPYVAWAVVLLSALHRRCQFPIPQGSYTAQIRFIWMYWSYSCDSHVHHGLGWVETTDQTTLPHRIPRDNKRLLHSNLLGYCFCHIKIVLPF